MELGISPIVTSGMIIQLLVGTNIIQIDQSVKSERVLLNAVQKLIGILFTFVQAFAYVLFGMYGPLRDLGFSAILIVVQLTVAGIIITILVCNFFSNTFYLFIHHYLNSPVFSSHP